MEINICKCPHCGTQHHSLRPSLGTYVSAGDPADLVGATVGAAGLFQRRPLRDRLAQRLVDAAVEKGADRAKAEEVVSDLASDRPLLDWLLNGGWEKLLDLILKLIALV